jgi:hypothetical protein
VRLDGNKSVMQQRQYNKNSFSKEEKWTRLLNTTYTGDVSMHKSRSKHGLCRILHHMK